jgi:hypothetical protein
MGIEQPWKQNWPEGFQDDTSSENQERGRKVQRDQDTPRSKMGGTTASPSPAGGKGAAPMALTMVDGTKIMRLDNPDVLESIIKETAPCT